MAAIDDPVTPGEQPTAGSTLEGASMKWTWKVFALRALNTAQGEIAYLRPIESLSLGLARLLPHQTFNYVRTAIARAAGVEIGARSRLLGPLKLTGPGDRYELLRIGNETVIGGPLHIDLGAKVQIGDRVHIGHYVLLLTVDHEIGPSGLRCGSHEFGAIAIGDGAWIGSRVTVLPGVSIGAGAVVAAGAVVTRDVAPNTVVGGVPARLIRELGCDAPRKARHRRLVQVSNRN